MALHDKHKMLVGPPGPRGCMGPPGPRGFSTADPDKFVKGWYKSIIEPGSEVVVDPGTNLLQFTNSVSSSSAGSPEGVLMGSSYPLFLLKEKGQYIIELNIDFPISPILDPVGEIQLVQKANLADPLVMETKIPIINSGFNFHYMFSTDVISGIKYIGFKLIRVNLVTFDIPKDYQLSFVKITKVDGW